MPAYEEIAQALRSAILRGTIPPGMVLLEGPLAGLFNSSRSPVRQALDRLLSEGLASRFEGRGLVAGDGAGPPLRLAVDPAMFEAGTACVTKIWGWERLYHEVERHLIQCSVIGCFRINERELAAHFGIGRTVARDVLVRIQSTGILAKDRAAHWVTVPLDDRRLRDLYAVRAALEPPMIARATPHLRADRVAAMRARIDPLLRQHAEASAACLDGLEHDLHVTCIEEAGNPEMLGALARTRCVLIASKHIAGADAGPLATDPFLAEHDAVLAAVQSGDAARAADAMAAHLDLSVEKASRRLAAFRTSGTLPELPFIGAGKEYAAAVARGPADRPSFAPGSDAPASDAPTSDAPTSDLGHAAIDE